MEEPGCYICGDPLWAIGMCIMHAKRQYAHGDAETYERKKRKRFIMPHGPQVGHLWCSLCVRELPLASFDKSQDDGYRQVGRCRTCMSLVKAASSYNTTIERLLEMEREQDYKCAICHQPETKAWRLSVDHDHTCCPGKKSCGKCVRALLCDSCNRMIGLANEDVVLLRAAIDYLNIWSSRHQNRTDDNDHHESQNQVNDS